MSNPNDDPDVISGLCDDAKKEMATYPGPSQRITGGCWATMSRDGTQRICGWK